MWRSQQFLTWARIGLCLASGLPALPSAVLSVLTLPCRYTCPPLISFSNSSCPLSLQMFIPLYRQEYWRRLKHRCRGWGQSLRGEHPAWGGLRWARRARQWPVTSSLTILSFLAALLSSWCEELAACCCSSTSEEPPRHPGNSPMQPPPQLHELHETHSVAQVEWACATWVGPGAAGWVLDSHPSGPQVLDMSPGERTGVGP